MKECQKSMKTRSGRRAFLSLLPLLLASCASQKLRRSTNSLVGDPLLTVEDEKLMVRDALPEMRRDYPALRNVEIQRYVTELL